MKFSLLLLALLPLRALAGTPTDTFTPTGTISPTSTPTPGEGSYVISPAAFTIGSNGNAFELVYTAGATPWTGSGGLLTLYFPLGFTYPNATNFYPIPSDAAKVLNKGYAANVAQFQVSGLPAGGTLTLRYGYDPSGFSVGNQSSSVALDVLSIPSGVNDVQAGGHLLVQPTIALNSPTSTPTATPTLTVTLTGTISPTFTITETHSVSPTLTISATFTQTLTETPIGGVMAGELYTYPNPFNLALYDKVTLRFPPDPTARVAIFNLVGEPVAEIPVGDTNAAAGWAIWKGRDMYNRPAPGGVYYARVKGASTFIKRFTVLN